LFTIFELCDGLLSDAQPATQFLRSTFLGRHESPVSNPYTVGLICQVS